MLFRSAGAVRVRVTLQLLEYNKGRGVRVTVNPLTARIEHAGVVRRSLEEGLSRAGKEQRRAVRRVQG